MFSRSAYRTRSSGLCDVSKERAVDVKSNGLPAVSPSPTSSVTKIPWSLIQLDLPRAPLLAMTSAETKRRPLHVAIAIPSGGSIGEPVGANWAITDDGTGAPKIVEAMSRAVVRQVQLTEPNSDGLGLGG